MPCGRERGGYTTACLRKFVSGSRKNCELKLPGRKSHQGHMSGTLTRKLLHTLIFSTLIAASAFGQVSAQNGPAPNYGNESPQHQHDSGQSRQSMGDMQMDSPMSLQLPSPHDSSGTSWQPASVTVP